MKGNLKVEPIVLASGRKHGVTDEDILHAYRNPITTERAGEMTMIVGSARNAALLEIGLLVARGGEGLLIVHAMPARPKYLR